MKKLIEKLSDIWTALLLIMCDFIIVMVFILLIMILI